MTVTVAGELFGAREMSAADRAFVFATWLPSAREALRHSRYAERTTFNEHYPAFVDAMLDTQRTVVLFRPSSSGVVHAWACGGGDVLHWAYVPPPLRSHGIGRAVMTLALEGYPDRIHVTTPFGREHRAGRFAKARW